MAGNATAQIRVQVDGLDELRAIVGVLVAAVDDVISRVDTLTTTVQTELEEVRALVEAGRQDEAKLDEAVVKLDSAITAVSQISEQAQTPEEPEPTP